MSDTHHDDGGPASAVVAGLRGMEPARTCGHQGPAFGYFRAETESLGETVWDKHVRAAITGLLASRTFVWGESLDVHQLLHHAARIADAAIEAKRTREAGPKDGE